MIMSKAVAAVDDGGRDALNLLKSSSPPSYLNPLPELSNSARVALTSIFSSLVPYSPKCPFSRLLTDGYDVEQIWQQIDLQSRPLLSSLARQVKNFENNPPIYRLEGEESVLKDVVEKEEVDYVGNDGDEFDDEGFESLEEDESGDEEEGDDEDEEEDGDEEMEEGGNGVEDRFLKIDELEEYLEKDEAREYGFDKGHDKKKKEKKKNMRNEESADEDEEEEDDDELGILDLNLGDEDEEENAKYDDFFGRKKDRQKKNYSKSSNSHEKMERDDDEFNLNDNHVIHTESHDLEMHDDSNNLGDKQKNQSLSTHEKEQQRLQSEIEKMEKSNLEPKTWTMQGEVTASKRPKNSALEVSLDFEHNVRPPPVITEEVTASLEELIRNRVIEGRFDDVQKPATFLNKAPREKVELDENKSKEGLAKLYEGDYAQKTGLVSQAVTYSDEQKKEANQLFKKLCLKLDALSHFHFTPKPVIEDMSIQTNIPALAMEEIAPLAVSEADMLAPEEVFAGKGNIKEEAELTKEERKRRRSNKKRKFKAEDLKQMSVKAQKNSTMNQRNGNVIEDSHVVT